MARGEKGIDDILETLYALDVQGYMMDEKLMKSEAMNRLKRTLDRLTEDKRKPVEDEAAYRLDQFEKFQQMKKKERKEIIQIAKDKHVSIEEAYKIAADQALSRIV